MLKTYKFYNEFYSKLNSVLKEIPQEDYNLVVKLIKNSKKNNIYFFGNGGSSSISSHVSVDFLNIGYKSINFNDHNLITCLSNDFGYENWIVKSLQNHAKKNELIILTSSSGMSKNIITAAKFAKKKGMKIITLSGFKSNNSLRKLGDINFWVNSNSYNIVEMAHHIILVSVIDFLKK